jgi:hypothetical protein
MKHQNNYLFQNWAKNVQHAFKNVYQPKDLKEIQELIKTHQNLRMVGSGHSWAHLWKGGETLIDLSQFYFEPIIYSETLEVELSAGMKIFQINQFLDKNNLALQNLGSYDQQSIAGAIATGTHGTGKNFRCLASQCTEFTFIDGTGQFHTLTPNHPDFYACLVALGKMGIITKLKIQVVPAFNLHEHTFTCTWKEAIQHFTNWLSQYDHLKIWWLPPSDYVVVYALARTHAPIHESKWQNFWREKVLSVGIYRLFVILGNIYPRLRPSINRFLTSQMKKTYLRTNKSYKIFKVPSPPKHRETEWAFPLENYHEILTNYFQRYTDNRFTFNFIQEIRISKADDFWLSPAYQRDSLWIGLYNHYDKQWNELLKDFQQFALAHHARPHLGKEYHLSSQELSCLFPKWIDFQHIRKKYDPMNKFSSETI